MLGYGMNKAKICVCNFIVVVAVFTGVVSGDESAQEYLSPVALMADIQGRMIYIAEATAKQVAVFDIATGKVTRTYSLPAAPSGLALASDGWRLYVTVAATDGQIHVVELQGGNISYRLPAGHTPGAPVVSPDGKTLYVCNRFDNNVSVIDLSARKEVARIAVQREPVAAAITADGKLLFVANHLPAGAANRGYVAAAVSVIDTTTNHVVTSIQLPNGSTALQGICISADGRYAYVTHILARYTLPTTQLERGWVNTNALSVIDVNNKKLVDTVLLDDVDYGAANPWAVACTSDGKYICVTHAGTDELSIIDAAAMMGKITKYHSKNKDTNRQDNLYSFDSTSAVSSNIPNELSFLYGIRQRVKLCGKGARALAVIGSKVYVAEYFTDSLSIVDINKESRPKATSVALGRKRKMNLGRKGQMLFNDASLCFQQWQSCASCHPSQGRPDGLNWDLLNDGIGNPKNTKSLLLSHKTPPAMITGVRKDAEEAVRAGIRHIQFAVRPEEDAVAIDEYLKSLQPAASPYLVKGKLSKAARRGRKVFEKAGCGKCHAGPLYTDLKKYDVGTGKGLDEEVKFDTPTLIELWRTAPYLYDGRAETIKEVLTRYNPDDKHGVTSNLAESEISDLAEFILSL